MSTVALLAFNLLVNGVLSFAMATLFSRAALRLFRPRPGPLHLALSSLPFVKLTWDLLRGVPANSFLWLRARGVPQDLGQFRFGVGAHWGIPRLELVLGARSLGRSFSQSAPDLLAALLTKRVGPWAPGCVVALLLLVSLHRLVRRATAWRSETRRFGVICRNVTLSGRRRFGRRWVSIVVSDLVAGSPYTGGVLTPYICFSTRVWNAMNAEERRAAIAHEMAHVTGRHLLIVTVVGVLRDVFWFVPLIAGVTQRVHDACELAADSRVLQRGISRVVLASALVRSQEATLDTPRTVVTLAASGACTRSRIRVLLDEATPPRFGFRYRAVAVALTGWVFLIVLTSTALGNQ